MKKTSGTGQQPGNDKSVQPGNQPVNPPQQHDDPTSAQDDEDLPSDERFIPTQADQRKKESVEYFTPSGELPGETLSEDDLDPTEEDASPEILSDTDADLDADDFAALGSRDEEEGDDEYVRARNTLVGQNDDEDEEEPIDGLDIPGAEEDDDWEDVGAEDEENNEYSLDDQDEDEDEGFADYDDR